jgi:hypothetical protein
MTASAVESNENEINAQDVDSSFTSDSPHRTISNIDE